MEDTRQVLYILYEIFSKFCVCLLEFLLYIHGKHLRSCRDGHFFNHTLSGQASQGRLVHQYLVSIFSPEQLAILESRSAEEGNNFFNERMCRTRGLNSGLLAYEADTLPTKQRRLVIVLCFFSCVDRV